MLFRSVPNVVAEATGGHATPAKLAHDLEPAGEGGGEFRGEVRAVVRYAGNGGARMERGN